MNGEIEAVLNEEIRPGLAAHGGDIGSYSFQDGVFRFRFTGACAQCPSAFLTAEQMVAERLQARLPQVKSVILERGVSQELQDQALSILRRKK